MVAGYTAISDRSGRHNAWSVKGREPWPLRVLNCRGSGTNSGVIAGVDWVAAQSHRPAVANMSLGGGVSTALDNAVTNALLNGATAGRVASAGAFLLLINGRSRSSMASEGGGD